MIVLDYVRQFLYGKAFWRYKKYDTALMVLEDFGNRPLSYLRNHPKSPHDFTKVYKFLESEGLCTIDDDSIQLTEKGRLKLLSGGFTKNLIKERITFFSVIIGIIGVLSGLLSQCI